MGNEDDLGLRAKVAIIASSGAAGDGIGMTWLAETPAITMLRQDDAREPQVAVERLCTLVVK